MIKVVEFESYDPIQGDIASRKLERFLKDYNIIREQIISINPAGDDRIILVYER